MIKRLFFLTLLALFILLSSVMLKGSSNALALESRASSRHPESASTNAETSTPSPSPTPTITPGQGAAAVVPLIANQPTQVSYGPNNFPIVVNPLTGLPVENFSILDRRPMVVKVTNYPRSVRPQPGLSSADIVYEYYMEQGISRFIAVFYGQDAGKVGPVRSGRFFDEHIFTMYDGIFVFGSADHRVIDRFFALGDHIVNSLIIESEEDKKVSCKPGLYAPLCRDRNIKGYNNMFTNTAAMTEYITNRQGNYRPNLNGMRFAYRTPPGGELGLNVYVRFSLFMYTKWEYSIESGRYLRYQETIGYPDPSREEFAPHTDQLTGEQISADNLVVLVVPHEYFTWTPTTEILKIHLVDSGPAIIFRDGFAFQATWSRPSDGGVLNLYGPDGEHFPLKPGVTWYSVISQYSSWYTFGIDWRFTFQPPPEPDEPLNPESQGKPKRPTEVP